MGEEGIVLYDSSTEGMLAQADHAEATLRRIESFRTVARRCLHENRDYGKIPGTGKLTLLKPGAEKLLLVLGINCSYQLIDKVEDYGVEPYFDYTVRAIGVHNGTVIAEGLGNANTREKRYHNQITSGKTTAFDLKNTVLKIAEKRAKVDLALHVGALSDVFEHDLEDSADSSQRAADDQIIDDNKPILARDVKVILGLRDESGLTDTEFGERMKAAYGTVIVKDLTRKQGRHLKRHLEELKAKARDAEAMPKAPVAEAEVEEEPYVPDFTDDDIPF